MAGEYALDGLAVPASLDRLHVLLAQVRHEHPDVSKTDLMMLELAVIEVAGNVVEHGRPQGSVVYSFRLTVHDDTLECVLSDSSEAVTGDLSDGSLPVDALSEGGRGLAVAQAALDHFRHVRVPGGNVWHMIRQRA